MSGTFGVACVYSAKVAERPELVQRVRQHMERALENAGAPNDVTFEEPTWGEFYEEYDDDGRGIGEPYWAWELIATGEKG